MSKLSTLLAIGYVLTIVYDYFTYGSTVAIFNALAVCAVLKICDLLDKYDKNKSS